MFARYPLVRNSYAFFTRLGVSSSPSRSGSSPSSLSSFLISSCICLFYISTISAAAQPAPSADALYEDRANIGSARQAADLWAADLAREAPAPPSAFEAAWKLARADYWLGGHAPENERRKYLEQGIEASRKAMALQPNRPEGHFWLAANMGTLAESFGMRQGLKYRKPIKEELELVLKMDPAFMQGSADRALGRWYFKVPGSLRRQQQGSGGPPAHVAEVQPEQLGVALLSRGGTARRRAQGRRARRAAESAGRAARSGLDAGGQGVQGEGTRAPRETLNLTSVYRQPSRRSEEERQQQARHDGEVRNAALTRIDRLPIGRSTDRTRDSESSRPEAATGWRRAPRRPAARRIRRSSFPTSPPGSPRRLTRTAPGTATPITPSITHLRRGNTMSTSHARSASGFAIEKI